MDQLADEINMRCSISKEFCLETNRSKCLVIKFKSAAQFHRLLSNKVIVCLLKQQNSVSELPFQSAKWFDGRTEDSCGGTALEGTHLEVFTSTTIFVTFFCSLSVSSSPSFLTISWSSSFPSPFFSFSSSSCFSCFPSLPTSNFSFFSSCSVFSFFSFPSISAPSSFATSNPISAFILLLIGCRVFGIIEVGKQMAKLVMEQMRNPIHHAPIHRGSSAVRSVSAVTTTKLHNCL